MMPPARAPSPYIQVLAAVILREDHWLLCLRPGHKRHGGCWEFPGGKVEPGETLADAARRELKEELGVEAAAVGDVVYSRHDAGSPYIIEFAEVVIAGEPLPHEHDDVRWVRRMDALALPLAPADRAFVLHALRG
jgi:8-oxo-dGTP diphosphatase